MIEGFIEAGFDILNPVQTSARGMDPRHQVDKYGGRIIFWGGGVDTQRVLGVASPEEIRAHVRRNIDTLAPGGGFVFATVHDIQANVPPQNIMAMHEAWREYGLYS